MTHESIVATVRQQIASQGSLGADQAAALLEIVETLEVQRKRERELVLRAELDQNAYRALIAAHDALITTHIAEATKRVRTEEALKQSEERFHILFEHSPDSILVVDPHHPAGHWPIVDCNEVSCRMNGYTREELLGQGIDLLHDRPTDPADRAEFLDRLRREGTIHLEGIHRRKDGTSFPIEISTSLIMLNGREFVLGIDRDMSGRRRDDKAQRFLAEASALLQSSLDYNTTLQRVADLAVSYLAAWCSVAMLENDGSIHMVAAVHADPSKIKLARELYERYPIDPNALEGTAQVLRTGKPLLFANIPDARLERVALSQGQLDLLQKMGFASAMIVPLVARGRTLGAISFVADRSRPGYGSEDLKLAQDLAHRAALAVDNARLYQEVHQALDARDEFLSLAAHELKAPLTTLFGSTRLLQQWIGREDHVGDRTQQVLALAEGAAQNLEKLIDSLIDFSRIQSGRLSLEQQPVDLCGLARLVIEEMGPVPRHSIQLACADDPLIVEGDEVRLELVLHNLLQNAVKYSPKGGKVYVRLDRKGGNARIAVIDTGIGIPETALAQLFQRFYRASNADQAQIGGTGIGLYLVNEIVTRHGGKVEVTSTEGQGSTFTVILPLRHAGEMTHSGNAVVWEYAGMS
jgi:PAS domain S-box-containing protein